MKRRITALLILVILIATICPATLAVGAEDVSISAGSPLVTLSHAYIPVTITLDDKATGTLDDEATKTLDDKATEELELISVSSSTNLFSGSAMKLEGETKLAPGGSLDILLSGALKSGVSGSAIEQLTFNFKDENDVEVKKTLNVSIAVPVADGGTDTETAAPNPAFRLSSYDANGLIATTASGKNGGRVQVRLPLLCVNGAVNNIRVTPKLSTSLDEFPFAIEQVDYTSVYEGSIFTDQIIEFQFDFRFSEMVTAGVKKVDFTVTYDRGWGAIGGSSESCDISLYVNVTKGYEPQADDPSTGATTSLPRLMVKSYEFSTDKIYAGESFDINFTLHNTSTEEGIRNILITLTDDAGTGKMTPAGGSNTIFIDAMEPDETKEVTLSLQTAPDTEAKAYKLTLDFDYEGTKTRPATVVPDIPSASIAVTIMQKIRLKFDDPIIDGEAMVGESLPIYFAMYNMGRSAVYNCMIDVEGEGLSMEETYFSGTVNAGNTMRADFSIITETPGQIDGFIVVTYEDSLEEKMEERLPISLFVAEGYSDPGMMDPMLDPGMMPGYTETDTPIKGGGFPWLWVVLGAAVIAAIVVAIILIKKKRRMALEDL